MEAIELSRKVSEAAEFTKKLAGLAALGVAILGMIYIGQATFAWGRVQYANFLQYAIKREFGGLSLEVTDEKGKLRLVNAKDMPREQLESSLVWLMQDRVKVQYAFGQAQEAFDFYAKESDER